MSRPRFAATQIVALHKETGSAIAVPKQYRSYGVGQARQLKYAGM